METRANHVLIGSFAIIVILGAFGFLVWLGKAQVNKERDFYDIFFEGTVTGLGVAGDVRYNGIKVGDVVELKLKENDPSKVRVRIEVDAGTPVSKDTVATLEFMGVTGVSYVLLSGGGPTSEKLPPREKGKFPVIASKTSTFQDIFAGTPQLVGGANDFVGKLNLVLNEDNRRRIDAMIANAEIVMNNFAESSGRVSSLVNNLDNAAGSVKALTENLETLTINANQIVDQDLRHAVENAADAAKSAAATMDELQLMVRENRESISSFTRTGLGDVTRLATEARQLVRTLDRVAARLDSDPQSLVYGSDAKEVKLK